MCKQEKTIEILVFIITGNESKIQTTAFENSVVLLD